MHKSKKQDSLDLMSFIMAGYLIFTTVSMKHQHLEDLYTDKMDILNSKTTLKKQRG